MMMVLVMMVSVVLMTLVFALLMTLTLMTLFVLCGVFALIHQLSHPHGVALSTVIPMR